MAWGIPDNHKIHRSFLKCERGLKHVITNRSDRGKIVLAAEKLREVKLRLLKFNFSKSTRSQYQPSEEALQWEAKSVDDIISHYEGLEKNRETPSGTKNRIKQNDGLKD